MNNSKAIREINSMQTFSDYEVSEKENAICRTVELILSYVEVKEIVLDVAYINIENKRKYTTAHRYNVFSLEDNVFSAIHDLFVSAKQDNDLYHYPTRILVYNFSVDRKTFTISLNIEIVI